MKFDIRPLSQKWFAESTPQNYKPASATLGSGDNGTITINALGVESDAVISVAIASGATAISTATETDVTFTSGQLGTPCAEAYIGFINGSTYYVCTKADNSTKNNGWRSFSLTNY